MPRKAVLDDYKKRNRVIRVLRDGGDNGAAAKEIGISRQSLQNYIAANPEFAARVERAKEQAMMASAVEAEVEAPPVVDPPSTPVGEDAVIAAEIMGVDPDLVADIDEILSDELIELATRVDLRRPSARGFFEVCWRRFISNRPDAALHGRLIEKGLTRPTLLAQARRDAAAARREMLAEQRAAAERVEGKAGPSGAGMLVLEAPPNNARPFMAAKPDPGQAEVVE